MGVVVVSCLCFVYVIITCFFSCVWCCLIVCWLFIRFGECIWFLCLYHKLCLCFCLLAGHVLLKHFGCCFVGCECTRVVCFWNAYYDLHFYLFALWFVSVLEFFCFCDVYYDLHFYLFALWFVSVLAFVACSKSVVYLVFCLCVCLCFSLFAFFFCFFLSVLSFFFC